MLSTIASSTINRPLAQQLRPAFQRSAIPKSTRIAAFHATQRNQILPPLPQKIIGTTNDPTPVPNPDYAHGSYHWSFERYDKPDLRTWRNKRNMEDVVYGESID
jgi:succinate dehydrogenase (ubiquinone) membrane anchor subunit